MYIFLFWHFLIRSKANSLSDVYAWANLFEYLILNAFDLFTLNLFPQHIIQTFPFFMTVK